MNTSYPHRILPPNLSVACATLVLLLAGSLVQAEESTESPIESVVEKPAESTIEASAAELVEKVALTQEEEQSLVATVQEVASADEDIMSMDVGGSLIDGANVAKLLSFGFDVRTSASWSETEDRFGETDQDNEVTARVRLEGDWNPIESVRLTARLAGICSSESCAVDTSFESGVEGDSILTGKFTVDELFVHWFRTERFDLALGRLQTRFVTRGGVFAKSLDRNNSNNTNINWTDGLHSTFKARNGWLSHLIVEYNDENPGSVRRDPLDFSTGKSELSHFFAVENTKPWGRVVQRGLDISYLPDSLLTDGDLSGRRDDYWAIVARGAMRFRRDNAPGERRWRLAGEIGYAPNTPTRLAVDTGASGDTDGLAWNVSASLMDFAPRQSIGLLYGRTGAGWLISPQYRPNEEQLELRWSWRRTSNLVIDARVRLRDDLDPLGTGTKLRNQVDAFVRATWRYTVLTK